MAVVVGFCGLNRTEYSGGIGVHGRVLRVAKDRVSKVLGAKRVLCHSLLLDMTSERVLVHEPILVTKRVHWSVNGKSHVAVRDVHVHLGVRWACDERRLVEWILFDSVRLQYVACKCGVNQPVQVRQEQLEERWWRWWARTCAFLMKVRQPS
jgi:hypothetical protein